MALEFLRDAGVYLLPDDGIKFTAVLDGIACEYIVTRATLITADVTPTMDRPRSSASLSRTVMLSKLWPPTWSRKYRARFFVRAVDV
jgi:hypothetical protein